MGQGLCYLCVTLTQWSDGKIDYCKNPTGVAGSLVDAFLELHTAFDAVLLGYQAIIYIKSQFGVIFENEDVVLLSREDKIIQGLGCVSQGVKEINGINFKWARP